MKIYVAILSLCLALIPNLSLATEPPAEANCSSFLSRGNALYKYQASGHLANTERANSCSFITGIGGHVPSGSCHKIYAADGTVIGKFGAYQKFGYPFAYRAYTAIGCSPRNITCKTISRRAKQHGGTREAWIQLDSVSGGGKRCFKVNDMQGRTGNAVH